MSTRTDAYSDWDAAYVLGGLAPEDRRDYERHLAGCEACSRAVAELAGLPGLLGAVPAEQALSDAAPKSADPETGAARMPTTTLPRLLVAARRERSRSRGLLAGALVGVAAIAAAGALAVTGWAGLPGGAPAAPPAAAPASTTLVMSPTVPSPLRAELTLQALPWGTRIVSRCSYADEYGTRARAYALYLTDRDGATSLLATWLAAPGSTVAPVGTTSLTEADIATVDIRSLTSGEVLLESSLAR